MINLLKVPVTIAIGAATIALISVTEPVQAMTLVDFETGNGLLPPGSGQQIDGAGLFTDFGLTINTKNPHNRPLVLFNSNCAPDFAVACTGNDPDLASGDTFGTDPQGNVLIIQESNVPNTNPNDDANGGKFKFGFTDPGGVTFKSVSILDLDEGLAPVSFKFFFSDANSMKVDPVTVNLLSAVTGDNSLREFLFDGLENVVRLDVKLKRVSGAIASVGYERPVPVPTPAAVLPSLLGMGISAIRRRKLLQADEA